MGKKTRIEKREVELLMICLGLTIIILGIIANYFVIMFNECKMPVPYGDYEIELTERHFFFNNPQEINLYILSDIIPIFGSQYSLGDILIWLGMILTIGFTARYIIKFWFATDCNDERNNN